MAGVCGQRGRPAGATRPGRLPAGARRGGACRGGRAPPSLAWGHGGPRSGGCVDPLFSLPLWGIAETACGAAGRGARCTVRSAAGLGGGSRGRGVQYGGACTVARVAGEYSPPPAAVTGIKPVVKDPQPGGDAVLTQWSTLRGLTPGWRWCLGRTL